LSQILFSAFPGSTVYQHTDPLRVPHDALNDRVNAVVLEVEMEKKNGLDLMRQLRRQKPELPVFIVSQNSGLYEAAVADGAVGFFVLPDNEAQLLDAIRLTKNEKDVS
jgi:DNA-binding NarL/FixJ family response regulator